MMRPRGCRLAVPVVLLVALCAGCSHAAGEEAVLTEGVRSVTTQAQPQAPPPPPTTVVPTTVAPTTVAPTTVAAVTTVAPTTVAPTAPPPTPAPPPRSVHVQAWTPFATAGGVVLQHPSNRVERIGFHESNLDGARQLESLPTSAPYVILDDRERDTGSRTAADVMVDPDSEIRAPVSGTVRYAGTYVLYCKYSDDFLVIEPDQHLGWEVKVLHIDGVQVRPGNRVQAGVTVIAPRATRLPFESQVEEGSARPAWPHVHVEIDDPSIPDRPSGGGC